MTLSKAAGGTGKYLLLAAILIWSGVPILLVVLSSFKDARFIFEFPPRLLFELTARNYVDLAATWPEFFSSLLNSLIVTVGAAFVTIVISFFAGYAYSRFSSRKLTASAFFLLVIRMFPPIIISIPLYPVIRALNLFDSHFTLIIFYAAFFVSLGTWLMKSFIDQIPKELEEAAFMDGANTGQILARVILPLSAHGLMATSTFVIIFAWKEYLFAMLFTTTRAKTAPLIIGEMLGSVTGVQWGALFAAAAIQLVPLLVYIYFIQNVLIEGATVGAVKG
jgi:multiple sugar transport system permease protein